MPLILRQKATRSSCNREAIAAYLHTYVDNLCRCTVQYDITAHPTHPSAASFRPRIRSWPVGGRQDLSLKHSHPFTTSCRRHCVVSCCVVPQCVVSKPVLLRRPPVSAFPTVSSFVVSHLYASAGCVCSFLRLATRTENIECSARLPAPEASIGPVRRWHRNWRSAYSERPASRTLKRSSRLFVSL